MSLCVLLFVQDRSLLLDSLNVARNIGERSFIGLVDPLSYEQSAPLLFLWISELCTSIMGITHYSLRILPLLAGLVSLLLFADISKTVLKSPFSLIALFWFGTHQLTARYATEYKQYMVDVFVGLLIIWIVLKIKKVNKHNWWKLSIGGAILIWLSMPSVFFVISAAIYLSLVRNRENHSWRPLIYTFGCVGFSFLANYLIVLSPTIGSDHMQDFHNNFFLEGKIFDLDSLSHDFGLIIGQARMVVGKSGLAIGAVLISVVICIFGSVKSKRYELILLLLPIVGAYGASLVDKYSIIERLMLFSLPISILIVMMGVQYVYQRSVFKNAYVSKFVFGILALGLIVGFVEKQSFKYIVDPFEHEDNRSSLVYISNHIEKDRKIICTQHAEAAYDYYTRYDESYKDMSVGAAVPTVYGTDISEFALGRLYTEEKLWILCNHYHEEEIDKLINNLEKVVQIENSHRAKSSAAILISIKDSINK